MPTAFTTVSQPARRACQARRVQRRSKCASRNSPPRSSAGSRRAARRGARVPISTSWPRAVSASATCRPMNPVPPSTSTRMATPFGYFGLDRNVCQAYIGVKMGTVHNAVRSLADPLAEALGAAGRRFVLHWGEMGWRWGVNRTVSQIHALLFLLGRPMHAEEIAELLGVARSNVSNSLRELENWTLVRVVHLVGDRRDHFETAQDPWELMRIIVRERKAREFDPTVAMLRECVNDPAFAKQDPGAQKRIHETLALMETLS